MKRFALIMVAILAIAGLVLSGCNDKKKDKAEVPETGKAAKEATADKAAEVAKAPEKADAIGADDAAKMAEVAAAMAKGVDTTDAPDYLKKMVVHLNQINKLTKENLGDCVKAADIVAKYIEANKVEMEKLSKTMETAADKLSDAEKLKMAQQLMALMAPTINETQKVMTEFAQKCPTQAAAVGQSMSALKAK
jgi:FtsZ-interacting cell division protein ZipA